MALPQRDIIQQGERSRALRVVPAHARRSYRAQAGKVKQDQSHIPLRIRHWLDRQIVSQINRSIQKEAEQRRSVNEPPDAVPERWANARAAAALTHHRH